MAPILPIFDIPTRRSRTDRLSTAAMEGISTSGRPDLRERLSRVSRRLCGWSAGYPGSHGPEQSAGCRPDAMAVADVHGEHRRRLPSGLLHHPVAGTVAVVELPAAVARDRAVRRVDHLLHHASRDAGHDRTPSLRPSRWLHRRQHHVGIAGSAPGHRRRTPGPGALMLVWLGVLIAGGVGSVLRFVVDGAVARRL